MSDLLTEQPNPADAQATQSPAGQGAGVTPPSSAPLAPASSEPSWRDDLPTDIRDNPALTKFSDKAGMAKSYINLEHMLGNDKVPVPKDDNDVEGWERFHKAAGRPDEPTGYEFTKPDNLPEGVTYDENMETWWRQSAHKTGMSGKQAKEIYNDFLNLHVQGQAAQERLSSDQVVQGNVLLSRDWGASAELNKQIATATFKDFSPEVQQLLTRAGLTRNPGFVKDLFKIGSKTRGETEVREGSRVGAYKTPDQITSEVAAFRDKHDTALREKTHPEHDQRVRELTNFYTILFQDDKGAAA